MESDQHPNQSISSEPSIAESSVSEPPVTDNIEQQQVEATNPALDTIANLVQTRPVMFWGGVWASILCVALVALSGLLSPSASSGHRASGAAVGKNTAPATQTARHSNRIPLWLFGAIALSCTAGSILVSKQVARPLPSRKFSKPKVIQPRPPRQAAPPKRLKPVLVNAPAQIPQSYPQQIYYSGPVPGQLRAKHPLRVPVQPVLAEGLPILPRRSPGVPTPKLRPTSSQRSRKDLASKQRPIAKSMKPRKSARPARVAVTVVPAEENHPLDWGNASLAETLDLRKQRPVSSWM